MNPATIPRMLDAGAGSYGDEPYRRITVWWNNYSGGAQRKCTVARPIRELWG